MAKWLFDSHGHACVYLHDNGVVMTRFGKFLGQIDKKTGEVWHGSYKGELFGEDRFLYASRKAGVTHSAPSVPSTPGMPGVPGSRSSISMPSGFQDAKVN